MRAMLNPDRPLRPDEAAQFWSQIAAFEEEEARRASTKSVPKKANPYDRMQAQLREFGINPEGMSIRAMSDKIKEMSVDQVASGTSDTPAT